MATGRTTYSEMIKGTHGNFNWPVRFDLGDGYVGITQFDGDGAVADRVLLSPEQVRELLAFLGK